MKNDKNLKIPRISHPTFTKTIQDSALIFGISILGSGILLGIQQLGLLIAKIFING